MSQAALTGPFCACLGCTAPADAIIDHPSRGRMHVCESHIRDFQVVTRDV